MNKTLWMMVTNKKIKRTESLQMRIVTAVKTS